MSTPSNDIEADLTEVYGYVNRSPPDGELDGFVDALATRIASFDKWAIVNTKHCCWLGRLYDLDRSAGCAGQDQGFV